MAWLDWQLGKVSFFSPSWKSWPSGWLLIQPKGHPSFFFLSLKTLSSLSLIILTNFTCFVIEWLLLYLLGGRRQNQRLLWGFIFYSFYFLVVGYNDFYEIFDLCWCWGVHGGFDGIHQSCYHNPSSVFG